MIRRPFADWVERQLEDHGGVVILLFVAALQGLLSAVLVGDWFLLEIMVVVVGIAGIRRAVTWDRWRRWERVERMRENHICLHCGYDMRATPERCSECGRWADEPVED